MSTVPAQEKSTAYNNVDHLLVGVRAAETVTFSTFCGIINTLKQSQKRLSGRLLIVYRIAVALVLVLALVLVCGSLYAVIRGPDSGPLFRIGKDGGEVQGGQASASDALNVFSGIGRLRIPLEGEPPATLMLSISFPYPADDRPFAEELAFRIGDFRSIAILYFGSLPPEKTVRLDETAAKTEILERYNKLLRLGKIETLYFGDLMVLK
jgi:flagellar basal body-associated protein FliL